MRSATRGKGVGPSIDPALVGLNKGDSFELVRSASGASDACLSPGGNPRFLSRVGIIQRSSASNRCGEQTSFLRTFERAPPSIQLVNE